MGKKTISWGEWVKNIVRKPITKVVALTIGAIALGGGVYYVVRKRRHATRATKDEVKEYVFFGSDGKPFCLSESDVFSIKQKYADGVLVPEIAQCYNTTPLMVSRIVNGIKL